MKTFVTSDQHWGHSNIIMLSAWRSFKDVDHMNEHMVEAWNKRVGPEDTVYHLGDIFWHKDVALKILPRLNGNIKLILGNHDWWWDELGVFEKIQVEKKIEIIPPRTRVNINKTKIWLDHYPLRCWEGSFNGAMHLYGHVHNTIDSERLPRSMDISVDAAGYEPWTLEEVWETLSKDKIMPEEQRITGGLKYSGPAAVGRPSR
jgi:calcineurin-like phosphoesterase family protein